MSSTTALTTTRCVTTSLIDTFTCMGVTTLGVGATVFLVEESRETDVPRNRRFFRFTAAGSAFVTSALSLIAVQSLRTLFRRN